METASGEDKATRRVLPRSGGVEGYIALFIMLVFVLEMFSIHLIPQFGSPIDQAIGMTLFALGMLFAISGSRRGRGGARVAARLSLAFFALLVAFIVVATQFFPRR